MTTDFSADFFQNSGDSDPSMSNTRSTMGTSKCSSGDSTRVRAEFPLQIPNS